MNEKNGMKKIFEPGSIIDLQTTEPETINHVGQGWQTRWTQLRPGPLSVRVRAFHTPRLQYADAFYSSDYLLEGAYPAGSVLLALIRGHGTYSFKNRLLQPFEMIVMEKNDEIDLLSRGSHAVLTLAVESVYFHRSFRRHFGHPLSVLLRDNRLTMLPPYVGHFVRQMHGWMEFFERHDTTDYTPLDFAAAEDNILYGLFSLLRTEPIPPRSDQGRFDMRRARELLREHLQSDYTLSDLAEEMGVSVRTLQYNFRKHLGILPKEYLAKQKLNAIREELQRGGRDRATVAAVARRYGFRHMGHFIRQYRTLFGETPAQTLKKRKSTGR